MKNPNTSSKTTRRIGLAASLVLVLGMVLAPSTQAVETPTPAATPAPSSTTSPGQDSAPAQDLSSEASPTATPSSSPAPSPSASVEAPKGTESPNRRPPMDPDDPEVRKAKDDPNVVIPQSVRDNFGINGSNNFVIGRPKPGGSSTGTVPQGLEDFYSQKISWESCENYGTDPNPDRKYTSKLAKCGYLIVPVDYRKPQGPTIALGLLKVSVGSDPKKGTLFVDPGGPGGSGMSTANGYADRYAAQGLLQDFDIIGFDPRGVSSSAPEIRCISSKLFDAYRESGQGRGPMDPYMMTEGCLNNTWDGYQGIDAKQFLQSVGTNNVVKDLDMMRSVVGDQRLNYLGYSYGTSIGYQYALNFPENIRAMVLDAIVNPFRNNPEENAKYDEFRKNDSGTQDSGREQTFKQFLTTCAKEDGFEFEGKKVPCALGTSGDTEEMKNTWKLLKNYAKDVKPYWSESLQRPVSSFDYEYAYVYAMYSERLWPRFNAGLNAALAQAADEEDTPDAKNLLELSDGYFKRYFTGGYAGSQSSFIQISVCGDQYWVPSGYKNSDCAAQAEQPLRIGEPIKALTNVLAIAGTYDNATPYPNGVILAKGTGSTLLSVANNSHGTYLAAGISCADQITTNYIRALTILRNPGTPGVDTKDIYSNKIKGDQCQIDTQWRAVPTTEAREAKAGDTVEFTASGLTRGGKYNLKITAQNGRVIFETSDPVVASADGTIKVPVVIPADAAGGDYTVLVSGAEEITRVLADASNVLKITAAVKPTPQGAQLQVSAAKVSPGGSQSVVGTGFTPGAVITLKIPGTSLELGTVTVDAQGNFTKLFTLPAGFALGEYQVQAMGEDGKEVLATFEVVKEMAPEPVVPPKPVVPIDAASVDPAGAKQQLIPQGSKTPITSYSVARGSSPQSLAVTGASEYLVMMLSGSFFLLLIGFCLLRINRSNKKAAHSAR